MNKDGNKFGGTFSLIAWFNSSEVFALMSSLYFSCLVFSCSVRKASAALRDSSEKFQEVISGPSRACTVAKSGWLSSLLRAALFIGIE